jgi:putative transposase
LDYLKIYLLPKETVKSLYPKLPTRLEGKNLNGEVELISYCLMPNHYHLIVKQKNPGGVSKLIKQISNAYTYYFNRKYEKEGSLFQGKYKAIAIEPANLTEIIRYIHLNPTSSWLVDNPKDYQWSSHREYLEQAEGLCSKEEVLKEFESIKDFQNFINDQNNYKNNLVKIQNLVIDAH